MTKGNPKWEQFERSTQELLDLRSTPGSGNQWHDISDGRSRPGDPYKLMVDCKYTQSKSFSLNGETLVRWWDAAAVLGYHFALPVRLDGVGASLREWVTVSLDDYAELVDSIRATRKYKRCGGSPPPLRGDRACCRRVDHTGNHDNGEIEW